MACDKEVGGDSTATGGEFGDTHADQLSKQVVSLEFANDVLLQQLGEVKSKLAKQVSSAKRAMDATKR